MDFDSEELLPKIAIHKGMMNGSLELLIAYDEDSGMDAGYALVATTIALEGRIRNNFDICNNMLTTLSYSAGWSTAPKPVPAQPVYSGDTGDYGTAYYWYDEDGDVWYWNGYENEFISYGSDGYIDDDTGEYMESNDAG